MPKNVPTNWHAETGKRIRIARLAVGLSQEDVASELGMTYQAFQKIERGKTKLEAPTAVVLAGLFEMDVRALLGLKAMPPRMKQPVGLFR